MGYKYYGYFDPTRTNLGTSLARLDLRRLVTSLHRQ